MVNILTFYCAIRELFCFKKPYLDKDAINLAYLVAHEDLRPSCFLTSQRSFIGS